ncbi:SMI1/KNR4 family protein [Streptomyces sp. MB22_4]|uniref:SMI1/KNR4 family protein n=1 Tax=Streptomyces sp. MB22_4 TaxID=3383120 RepID=UPI0039A00627
MSHPLVTRLRDMLPPPSSGGDTVDWEELARAEGVVLPSDYREFVEVYGGGEIDEYLGISTPPVPGSVYGDLLDGFAPYLRPEDEAELAVHFPGGGPLKLLVLGCTTDGDVLLWLRIGEPDTWKIAVFRRQALYGEKPWTVFDGGLVEFLVTVLEGGTTAPLRARKLTRTPHRFLGWRETQNL